MLKDTKEISAQNLADILLFFEKEISTKDFARIMRRLLHATIMLHIEDEDKKYNEWVGDGTYWMNELLERIASE